MKEVTVITDTISSITPELEQRFDIMSVPYHLIMDDKDYADNVYDREKLFSCLRSYKNLPTHSACTAGEILQAYKLAGLKAKDVAFISISSTMSLAYNAALLAKDMAKDEVPDMKIEVVDSHSVTCGELLVVIAAAKAANEGKSLSEVTEVAHQIINRITFVNVPETLFFFERSGRSGGEPSVAKAPVPIYPLLEMDASTGGVGKFISKNRTKAKAIDALLDLVKQRNGDNRLQAAISYSDNYQDAARLKHRLVSHFNIGEVHVIPASIVTCVVNGPGCVTLGFHNEE